MTNEVKTPTKVLEVSRAFVKEFYKTATPEQKEWIKERIAHWTKENGKRKYFPAFRVEFAAKFLSNIVSTGRPKAGKALLDELNELDSEK